jgi:hypothetical protein
MGQRCPSVKTIGTIATALGIDHFDVAFKSLGQRCPISLFSLSLPSAIHLINRYVSLGMNFASITGDSIHRTTV